MGLSTTVNKRLYDAVWAKYLAWKEESEPIVRAYITDLVRRHAPAAQRLVLETTDQGGEGLTLREVQVLVGKEWVKLTDDLDDLYDDDELSVALGDLGGTFEWGDEHTGQVEYELTKGDE